MKRLLKHQSFINWIQKIETSIKALTVFQAFFARPISFFNITFRAITNKVKLVKLLMLVKRQSRGKAADHQSLLP